MSLQQGGRPEGTVSIGDNSISTPWPILAAAAFIPRGKWHHSTSLTMMLRTLCATYERVKQNLVLHDETPNKSVARHDTIPGFAHVSPNGKVIDDGLE